MVFLSSCINESDFPIGKSVTCDAEKISNKGDEFVAKDDENARFKGAHLRTNLEAHSGEYSVLTIPKKSAFALAYEIKRIEPNAYLEVSVWRKSKDGSGNLVVASNNTSAYYKAINVPSVREENGWERIDLEVFIPPNYPHEKLKIYVWNNGSDSAYFDDLKITRSKSKQYPDFEYEKGLDLVIDTSDFLKIMKKRKNAFVSGILQTSDNDWVKGILVDDDIPKKAKMRLKGDWLDHLWGNKWSYRVKMRKDNAFNRMRTFSLQTPSARNYLLEWLTHKLYHRFDVLTTRYGFIPLSLSGQPRGLYVWEEHFAKQLPEWNKRREGPIVKFSEDAFWQVQKQNVNLKRWPNLPYFYASVIEPFGQSKTMSNPVLLSQFKDALKLMEQYKFQTKTTHEIFDVDKLARYYAMLDLTHARHGMTWHNQRFYYNPVICKLEPIAFDGYTDHEEFDFSINDNMAFKAVDCYKPMVPQDRLILKIFTDTIFLNKYLMYLDMFSNEKTISGFLDSEKTNINYNDSLLKMEFPYYHYDREFITGSAKSIRNYLPELKKLLKERISTGDFNINSKEETFIDSTLYENTPEYFVTAYFGDKIEDKKDIVVINYCLKDIKFIGSGFDQKLITEFFDEPVSVSSFSGNGSRGSVSVDTSSSSLFFTVAGHDDIFSIPIIPWSYPDGITTQQELMGKIDMRNPIFEKISGDNIFIRKGKSVIDKPLIIPRGYNVKFYPGTEIDIINKAMIISYSPVIMNGTAKNPIIIGSSDFTGNGITILQADGNSLVENVVFENLNTLNYKTWTLTGAVTFYESDVTIRNTRFYRNQCEDALNIIRSEFTVENTTFDYIFGDAFDADFCTGNIISSKYTNIGNDAMDFSGSVITIRDTEVNGANDKGISGGEESTVYVINTNVTRANIGFASKDLSVVEVIDSKVESCNYGVVLLQKKPEYGSCRMTLKNTPLTGSKIEMLIEEGSVVIRDGITIEGTEVNLSAKFY